jgi:hypothetical protein
MGRILVGKANLLTCLEKRELLNQSAVSVDQLLEWGARFEEAGLINDAVDFYERANSSETLEKLLKVVSGEGDAFLYGRILKALGREAAPREWVMLGTKAAELGKEAFAREAFKRGGLEKGEEAETAEGGAE